jgi:hypothetical protein
VTDRGWLSGALDDLIRRGWVRPPRETGGGPPPGGPVAPLAEILSELDADRSDRDEVDDPPEMESEPSST